MTPGPEYHEQVFYDLIGKNEVFTDDDIQALRDCLSHTNFNMLRNHIVGKAQLRVDVELIESIRRFDKAGGDLVTRGNLINVWVLGFAIGAFLLGAGALWVSWLSYQLALVQVGQ